MSKIHFVKIMDPQPPEGTESVAPGGDGWVYAMPADPDADALDWWETDLIPYKDKHGVWCLGTTGES